MAGDKKKTPVKMIAGAVIAVSLVGCCVFGAIGASCKSADNQAAIQRARDACQAPLVFHVKPDGRSEEPGAWECVSQEVVNAQALAETQRQQAEAAAQAARAAQQPAAPADGTPADNAGQAQPDATGFPALIALIERDCEAYRAAPNDIRKSTIFRQHTAALEELELHDVRGTLSDLSTPQGGGSVSIEIEVERPGRSGVFGGHPKMTFRTGIGDAIRDDSPLYEFLGNMAEGSCIIFSADNVRTAAMRMEEQKVCHLREAVVDFARLAACQ